ncbi:MAG: aminopeptidase N, partial [Wenzhouxiangellaceae bacterium]|nr:aminopeptidase N [Wenzhouxiangellaceae bacterium]
AAPAAPLGPAGVGREPLAVTVAGAPVAAERLDISGETLTLRGLADRAEIGTEVIIRPDRNTALEGLYRSGGSLLTQCEAEGFRKITWFADRPDVMTRFRVRLEADRERYPLLLSNGNLEETGDLDDGRHFATWNDPFRKPSYLFAVVAGDLGCRADTFETKSGRKVDLKFYSEPANLDRLDHAMESLKHAMAWDERRFGREYDLDAYHVVATHDFNMGAMENKGLNIFNARYVLADHETATDDDFEAIESVIGHEYFHNWTGNRVTCRDWFQLTLKEGLTVYRDQEFSAEMRRSSTKRIEDVRALMARQFPEDAGPMAHPVRPERYLEINNFYTATVYEKGAEVVRMYATLLGRDGFRRGMDRYFERHDGEAVTCDDFRAAMADANGTDLEQFERWYRQVGTPTLAVEEDWDAEAGRLTLRLAQSLPEHEDNADLGPLQIPVRLGLLDADGTSLSLPLEGGTPEETHLVDFREREVQFAFDGLERRPVVSMLRGFSAPVRLEHDQDDRSLALLLAHDPDPMARWLAGRRLAGRVLDAAIEALDAGRTPREAPLLAEAWRGIVARADEDPGLAAELLTLPTESELARDRDPVPVEAIHAARRHALRELGTALSEEIEPVLGEARPAWVFEPADVARRRWRNAVLRLAVAAGLTEAEARAETQYLEADNMTDRQAALAALVHAGAPAATRVLADFEQRHGDDPLVMDKWFAIQATAPTPESVDVVARLVEHPAFSWNNPNKVRSLIGSLAQANPVAFHRADGDGYRLVGEAVARLDEINPQVASRLAAAFNRWTAHDAERRALMKKELEKLAGREQSSPDVEEIVRAALGSCEAE